MLDQDKIESILSDFIKDLFLVGLDAGVLNNDTSFLEKGIVDSTGIMELVGFVEQRFGIKVKDEELTPDNLDSIKKLAKFIRQKLSQPA
jgi:acyl carrier protein